MMYESGLLSDKEIMHLCQAATPMISPEPELGVSPKSAISYGLSSFGYDARLSDELYLLDGTRRVSDAGTVIDPKNFDRKLCSVLPIHRSDKGDYAIIPPHGFVLGCTVETFAIPDDILVTCIGKSTYARCFTGDTKVLLVGESPATFTDLIELQKKSKSPIFGYGIDEQSGTTKVVPLTNVRLIGNEEVFEVKFIDNSKVKLTADHEWITAETHLVSDPKTPEDGTLYHTKRVQTKDLKPGMRVCVRNDDGIKFIIVESIAPVEGGAQDVYCLTSEHTGNFALENGAFVSNCGLIVNVTPLEPEWKGQVTLELSNTTPHPVKVYVNEGICQFLFTRGTTRPMTTYADKHGKYQDQVGVTFPKMKK